MVTQPTKILVFPSPNGPGRTSRLFCVINLLINRGIEVILVINRKHRDFFLAEFPNLTMVELHVESMKLTHQKGDSVSWMKLLTSFISQTWKEHREVKKLVNRYHPSLIISDNRFGCTHSAIPSVILPYQIAFQYRSVPKPVRALLTLAFRILINRFSECWIPDVEAHQGLTGIFSHPKKLPANSHYVGILSRFTKPAYPALHPKPPVFDLLILLSGPEPYRTDLEQKILKQLVNVNMQVAIVRGLPFTDDAVTLGDRVHVFSYLDTASLAEIINKSALVICRAGYSNMADMVTLGKRAIFVPVPGQPEQEYLARYLMEKKIYFSIRQANFDLLYAVDMSVNYPGMVIQNNMSTLRERVDLLIPLA